MPRPENVGEFRTQDTSVPPLLRKPFMMDAALLHPFAGDVEPEGRRKS